jgi:hypothetical protein
VRSFRRLRLFVCGCIYEVTTPRYARFCLMPTSKPGRPQIRCVQPLSHDRPRWVRKVLGGEVWLVEQGDNVARVVDFGIGVPRFWVGAAKVAIEGNDAAHSGCVRGLNIALVIADIEAVFG